MTPAVPDSCGDRLDLGVGERPPFGNGESRCGGARLSCSNGLNEVGLGRHGQEDRVVEGAGWTHAAVGTVATGAVLAVESVEVDDVDGPHVAIRFRRLAGQGIARDCPAAGERDDGDPSRP